MASKGWVVVLLLSLLVFTSEVQGKQLTQLTMIQFDVTASKSTAVRPQVNLPAAGPQGTRGKDGSCYVYVGSYTTFSLCSANCANYCKSNALCSVANPSTCKCLRPC